MNRSILWDAYQVHSNMPLHDSKYIKLFRYGIDVDSPGFEPNPVKTQDW